MAWFDTHAHLQDEAYDADRQSVLERAAFQNVTRVLMPACTLSDTRKALEIASRDSRLCCAAGYHPHEAAYFNDQVFHELKQLIQLHRRSLIVAIGETGLDYHYDYSPRPAQQAVFRAQIELAHECGLPLIIHEREATADCLRILREAAADGLLLPRPGVFHCYSGSAETAATLLNLGFYLGVDGPVTFSNARKLPEVIRICPQDRLLLETDCPYLTPVPYRGQRNEPAYLPLIGAKVAAIWQISPEETARLTTANACRLFQLPEN
ncbi:MAG TPA: hydrolase TatD [Clostridiales bacterium]|nr:hydrolase TatD [Clostridiales bacterium]